MTDNQILTRIEDLLNNLVKDKEDIEFIMKYLDTKGYYVK